MDSVSNNKIRQVAIIGTGKMGTSLFEYLLGNNYSLTWVTRSQEKAEKLTKKTETKLKRFLKHGIISELEAQTRLKNICITTDYRILSKADLVIEAVSEDVGIKKQVLIHTFENIPGYTLVATNSSSIMPEDLFDSGMDISRLFGLHFFFPVNITLFAEMITHKFFKKDALSKLNDFYKAINLEVAMQDESNALLFNMLTMPIAGTAFIFAKRFGFKTANELASSEIFPTGPFYLFDKVGLDIVLAASRRYLQRDILKNRDHYLQLLYFMELMMGAKSRGEIKSSLFLGGGLECPNDLAAWQNQTEYPLETETKCRAGDIRKILKASIVNTCAYAVRHKFIEFNKLEYAWKKITGVANGPLGKTEEFDDTNCRGDWAATQTSPLSKSLVS